MRKKLFILMLVSIMVFSFVTGALAGSTFEKVKEQGYVTVGFANEAPFAYASTSGELTGQNVEIARAVLKELGINEMLGVLTEFASLIPGLKAGRFDMITAGMYITPDRAKEVDFADPEYCIGGGLAVEKGNPFDLHSYWDIADNPEVKIAVMAGVSEYEHLYACGVTDEQILTVPDNPAGLAALSSGRVDCLTATSPSIRNLVEKSKGADVEMVKDFEVAVVNGKEQRGFGSSAFRKEDDDFREAYNEKLRELKKSGKILEIQKKFGFGEAEFAETDVTAQDAIDNW